MSHAMDKVFCPMDHDAMKYVQTRGPYAAWYDSKLKRRVTAKERGGRIYREFWCCGKCGTVKFFDLAEQRYAKVMKKRQEMQVAIKSILKGGS